MPNKNTYHNSTLFKIFSLGLLLLLSPCSVRNSLQSVLQLEQTEVSSKSKVAQLNGSCVALEVSKVTVSTSSKSYSKIAQLLPLSSKYIGLASVLVSGNPVTLQFENQIVTPLKVPLYILYKNKKDAILA
ncbi:hypothetical protein [Formosa algae]|uniref:Uncharacterized protein n=1 Tax=Formosa algae TaxID=225843 RepID=A0A9X0YI50_9FLAO|nr:hypothetical protein [Formosa algae]MBP1839370.1 hypothetical protein [Formosa algae]MDQ0334674.1 hypothetical protein [Formosa algae]